jgi:hypothetical protein
MLQLSFFSFLTARFKAISEPQMSKVSNGDSGRPASYSPFCHNCNTSVTSSLLQANVSEGGSPTTLLDMYPSLSILVGDGQGSSICLSGRAAYSQVFLPSDFDRRLTVRAQRFRFTLAKHWSFRAPDWSGIFSFRRFRRRIIAGAIGI